MADMGTPGGLTERMVRAARLDIALYEEVEADTTATQQALTVVVIAAVASGVGSAIDAAMAGQGANPVGALIGGVITALVVWAVWAWVVYFVGTRLFKGTATYGELLRTQGFAFSPHVLQLFSFVPGLGGLLSFAVAIWGLAAGFIAARQALDLDNGRTIATIAVGVVAVVIILIVVSPFLALVGLATHLAGGGGAR